MVSEKFMINSEAERMAAVRYVTEDFAGMLELDRRNMLRLDLLVEETLGMVKAMVDDFYGQLWFESDNSNCEIHLQATANMNADKKDELLSMSSSGKNASTHGFMARIGEVISGALRDFGRVMDAYGRETVQYGIVHTAGIGMSGPDCLIPIWTLNTYRSELDGQRAKDEAAEAAWEDLEKSIVASLADDIIVGVKGDRIELVIVKNFGN